MAAFSQTATRYESHCQKSTFKASWPMRGSAELTTEPNPAELTEDVGALKFTRFDALKNSARNCTCKRSLIGKILFTPASQLNNPGARRDPFPRLPNVPTAGRANAWGFRDRKST